MIPLPGKLSERLALLLFGIVFILAIAARMAGVFTDFWFDEIQALNLSLGIKSPLEIIGSIHLCTNHWLYTFVMYIFGDCFLWVVYRIPSLAAGVASVLLIYLIARKDGLIEGMTAFILASLSFLLVVCSSEARGYAPLVLFSLAAFYAVSVAAGRRGAGFLVLFWISCILGFLSHLTFVFVWLALFVWSLARLKDLPSGWRNGVVHVLRWHAVPVLFLVFLYLVDIRRILHAGAGQNVLLPVLQDASAMAIGMPAGAVTGMAALMICVILTGCESLRFAREGCNLWIFYFSLLLLGPCLAAAAGSCGRTPQHFMFCVPFFVLLLARFIARGFRGTGVRLAVSIAAFLLYLAGNTVSIAGFLKNGRGHYLEAVRYMAAESEEPVFTIGSDDDSRNGPVLAFYARYLPRDRIVLYCRHGYWPAGGPDWYVLHTTDMNYVPKPELAGKNGECYRLVKHYPCSRVSGWHWHIYRNLREWPESDRMHIDK